MQLFAHDSVLGTDETPRHAAVTALLVAATGGHLVELVHFSERIPGVGDDAIWVTFDTPQSRTLLAGRNHIFVRYTASRDAFTTLVNLRVAARLMRSVRPSLVVSTGNAIALSFLPVARLFDIPALYIESAARVDGPSVTGRLLQRVPGIQLRTQYLGWAGAKWAYAGSVFDGFVSRTQPPAPPPRTVFVTLGTTPYSFRRLVCALVHLIPPDWKVTWQTGSTDVTGLDLRGAVRTLDDRSMKEKMSRADIVIAHAGVGSTLTALEQGKCPVLIPRELLHGEHVDDHQIQIGRGVAARDLAIFRSVDDLRLEALELAARRRTERRQGSQTLM